jgi:hypothetical protein
MPANFDRAAALGTAHHCVDHVHGRRADEPGHEQVGGSVVHLLRGVHLLQDAAVHHGHPVAHRHRLGLVMGDVDHGHAQVALDPGDLGAHLHAQLGIQVRQRLVHQERLRLAHDGASHRHPLPLAARQRPRLLLELILEPQRPGRLAHAAVDLLARHLSQLQPEGHVVVAGHVRVERVVLEHHRQVAVLCLHVVDDGISEADAAAGDLLQPGHHPQQRGLAAAGGADQHHQRAVLDREVDGAHGLRAVLVDLGHLVEPDLRHCAPIIRSHRDHEEEQR